MSAESELQRHRQDWNGFIKLTVYSTAIVAAVLVLMALFLL